MNKGHHFFFDGYFNNYIFPPLPTPAEQLANAQRRLANAKDAKVVAEREIAREEETIKVLKAKLNDEARMVAMTKLNNIVADVHKSLTSTQIEEVIETWRTLFNK